MGGGRRGGGVWTTGKSTRGAIGEPLCMEWRPAVPCTFLPCGLRILGASSSSGPSTTIPIDPSLELSDGSDPFFAQGVATRGGELSYLGIGFRFE